MLLRHWRAGVLVEERRGPGVTPEWPGDRPAVSPLSLTQTQKTGRLGLYVVNTMVPGYLVVDRAGPDPVITQVTTSLVTAIDAVAAVEPHRREDGRLLRDSHSPRVLDA